MVSLSKISKSFFAVPVLKDITIDFLPGEVHVLLGENGAGKSTLMKILSGNYLPDSGVLFIDGKDYPQLTPKEAIQLGICIIHQELSLISELSVQENIFMGFLPGKSCLVDYSEINYKTKKLMEALGLNINPVEMVKNLSTAERQMVEIAKALALNARIIIMDEPTTSLTNKEIEKLFEVIRLLKSQNKYLIYISHRLDEIKEIGDRVTVLRDGQKITTETLNRTSAEQLEHQINNLVRYMVGRNITKEKILADPPPSLSGTPCLSVKNMTRQDKKVSDISLDIFPGEIFGIAGLVGSGRTEFIEALFGLAPASGGVHFYGKKVHFKNPYIAIKEGIALLSENRRDSGIFQNFDIIQNISVVKSLRESGFYGISGMVNPREEKKEALSFQDILSIKCAAITQNITELSGGNQQKVLIARWLAARSRFFIFDEPTKGIDVGSKKEIHLMLRRMAETGTGVLVISSELPELLTIADRIGVFFSGRLQGVLRNSEASEEKIMQLAVGGKL